VKPFIVGTRGSALALAQVDLTRAALAAVLPDLPVEQKIFVTRGDQKLDLSLLRASEAGGKGLFTKELEDALLTGAIDVAVHSLKDLPGHNPPGLAVTAVLKRAAMGDVLITRAAHTFTTLPQGSILGTSSVRRARQLRWLRPDIGIVEWRGNVQTRLRKLDESAETAGIILAQAGLERLGYDFGIGGGNDEISEPSGRGAGSEQRKGPRVRNDELEPLGILEFGGRQFYVSSLEEHLLPAIGQGAIALQSRADRPEITAILQRIDHAETHLAIRAERELQRLLSGDCALPVGVRTRIAGGRMEMEAILFGDEGERPKRSKAEGDAGQPEVVAQMLFDGLR
jgi:hydroxymethylbilane synthase